MHVDVSEYVSLYNSRNDWGDIHSENYTGSPSLVAEFYGNMYAMDAKICKLFNMVRRRYSGMNKTVIGYLLGCSPGNIFLPQNSDFNKEHIAEVLGGNTWNENSLCINGV